MLNQIKTLLNIEVRLEEMKLENGTVVSADSFETDKEIFIVTDDQKVAMPVGEYLLEDGRLLVVEEEGMISSVGEVSDEAPSEEPKEDEEITEDLADEEEVSEEAEEEVVEEEEDMAVVEDWAGMEKRIQNLEDAIAFIKEKVGDKEEMGTETNTLKSRTVKEEFSEEVSEDASEEVSNQVMEKLSEPSAKPIKHNPESESEQKKKMEFTKCKFNTTALDRVLNRLNK